MRTEASLKTLLALPRFPSQHLNKTNYPCLPPLPACRIQIKASFSLRTLLILRLKILNVSVMCLFTSSRATSFGKSFFELREKDISDSFASFCESLFFDEMREGNISTFSNKPSTSTKCKEFQDLTKASMSSYFSEIARGFD